MTRLGIGASPERDSRNEESLSLSVVSLLELSPVRSIIDGSRMGDGEVGTSEEGDEEVGAEDGSTVPVGPANNADDDGRIA